MIWQFEWVILRIFRYANSLYNIKEPKKSVQDIGNKMLKENNFNLPQSVWFWCSCIESEINGNI